MSEAIYLDTSFPLKVKHAIGEELKTYKSFLREHQYIVRQFMSGKITKRKPRGLLLYHLMGTGKTMCMISAAVALNRTNICVMSKSLMTNFQAGIKTFSKRIGKDVTSRFKFISLDAYNFMEQVRRNCGPSFDGYTVIVDEAHELFAQVVNADNKNGPAFYEYIMKSADVHIIFATGTPIAKDPYEMVPCFNMLAGSEILPTGYSDFNSLFVKSRIFDADLDDTVEDTNIVNGDKLQNRLYGLISHALNDPKLFPRKLPVIIETIPMETKQIVEYRLARIKEKEEQQTKGKIAQVRMGKPKMKTSSTYRQKSRSLCNGYYDKDQDLDISPKLDKLMDYINKLPGKGIVYSQFRVAGVYRIANRLIGEGWTNVRGNVDLDNIKKPEIIEEDELEGGNEDETDSLGTPDVVDVDELEMPIVDGKQIKYKGVTYIRGNASKTFAILDGEVPTEIRKQILEIYNAPDNLDGQRLHILLVTTVGSRGINLIACRHSHYFEPYWYNYRLDQFETRAVRDGSHLMLPYEEQTVQLIVYLSSIRDPAPEDDELTTDQLLYTRAIKRQHVLDQFTQLMKEVSIECPHLDRIAHLENSSGIKCRMCAATDEKLFSHDVYIDISTESPCKPLVEQEVETTAIELDGIKYEYTKDNEDAQNSIYNIAIYEYDKLTESYKRIPERDPKFLLIFREIK